MFERLFAFLQSILTLPRFGLGSSPPNEISIQQAKITPENAVAIFNDLLAAQTPETPVDISNVNPVERTEPILINAEEALPVSLLRKFAPLRFLSESTLAQLAHKTLHYMPESVIFIVGQRTDFAYYLLQGSVEIRPQSTFPYPVVFNTPLSYLPLNSGYLCGSTAISTTHCIILAVSRVFLQRLSQRKYRYVTGGEFVKSGLPPNLPNNRFFTDFSHAYNENTLSLPCLPQVALRLKQAIDEPDATLLDIVNIVQFDPTIVAKLIQVANSVFYAAEAPITNCKNAVIRLGLDGTRRVVMGISVKHFFNSTHPELKGMMETNWRNSIYLSSLCFILAKESKTVSPEDALLAGLVCDIGKIPALNFAEQQSHANYPPNMKELRTALPFLSPPVGSLMLYNLGFPPELVNIPKFSEDWFYESGEEALTLIDIVILAKLHSYFGSKKAKYLPFLNTVPAYVKLNQGKLNGDFSLNVLNQAKDRIFEAMTFFA